MEQRNVLNIFHPVVREWFKNNIGNPSPPQVEGWPAILEGKNTLIVAPTGAGKTLSAFMECINRLFVQGVSGTLHDGVQVLYISPLKALNNDIYRNLEFPLKGIKELCDKKDIPFPEIRTAVRTGDTLASDRRKMIKTPPHILITTPESLYLLLTSENSRSILKSVKYVIIDEIHTLFGNKRGAHLALSIERLANQIGRSPIRIGLSATVKPVQEAAKYLGGYERQGQLWAQRPVTIVEPQMKKSIDLKISMPVKDFRVLEDKTVWPDIYRNIFEMVKEHRSTLVFVNNRAVAEKVAVNINNLSGKEIARAHHGCISRESRFEVEKQLKNGELPCLVATSSLELGIDVGAIDLVVQVASPKSVSRGLQRLGRAGHRLNAVSKGRIIPKTRGDLLESVIISREMLEGSIEEEAVIKNPLDILAQQLVAMSCVREWTLKEITEVIKSAYPYQSLDMAELGRVLCMLAGDYEHSHDTPRSPRIVWDRVNGIMRGNSYSRMLAFGSSGTIPDRGYYGVYLEDGKTRLGELDEIFVYEARIGDRFMLGTSAWRIEEIRRDRVVVSASGKTGAKPPFWTGDGLGRPYELGVIFGGFLDEISKKAGTNEYLPWILSHAPIDEIAAKNLEQYIIDQKRCTDCLASNKRIVIEYFSDDVGDCRMVIHSPFGGRVNGGLKIVMEQALGGALHCQVEASHNDDGVLINILGCQENPQNVFSLLSSTNAEDILIERLPTTPLFSMTFRYNAARALMMGARKYGKRTQLWAQRIRAIETLQIAEKYTDHPLIVETFRECMETVLDVPNLVRVLKGIESGEIEVVEKVTSHPSPFTSELLFSFMGVMMYEGQIPDPKKNNRRIISGKEALNSGFTNWSSERLLNIDAVHEVSRRNNPYMQDRNIKNHDELHDFLLTYGDIALNEVSELKRICDGNIELWLNKLKFEKRVTEIILKGEISTLYFAAEEYVMYMSALDMQLKEETYLQSDMEILWTREEALSRVLRRFARYKSPFTMEGIIDRYQLSPLIIKKAILRLEEDGLLCRGNFSGTGKEEFCHAVILDRIRKYSLFSARNSVKASNTDLFAGSLPVFQGVGKEVISPIEGLYDAIIKLQGLYLPAEWWEDFIFPARIEGYKKSYLDKLCSSGRIVWRIKPDLNTPKLAWYVNEELKQLEDCSLINFPNESEKLIYDVLKKKGASFMQVLSAATRLSSSELINNLEEMVWRGIIVNDSFEPIRYFLSSKPTSIKARSKMRAAAYKIDMGRWEAALSIEDSSIEEQLMIWFNRYGIVSKEILQCEKSQHSWSLAYEILKQWEYIGKVNRGYYIKGLSGIQFMLSEAAGLLNYGSSRYQVLDACDPAQVYGRIAPFPEESDSWVCVPGTSVVLKSGKPILIVECCGERFLPISHIKEEIIDSIKAFLEAFNKSQIWANQKRIKMRQWGQGTPSQCEFADELCSIGFDREMQDMVHWK